MNRWSGNGAERQPNVEPERLFAGTDLFLRYLTDDVPSKADAFEELLHRASAGEVVLVVNSMVIAEIVWTLESHYGQSRDSIRDKVLAILNTPGMETAEADLLLQAVYWYAEKNADFADAFNAAWLAAQGLRAAITLEHARYAGLDGVTVQVLGE